MWKQGVHQKTGIAAAAVAAGIAALSVPTGKAWAQAPANSQAPPAAAQQVPDDEIHPDAIVVSDIQVDRRKIRPGQTVTVSMTLRNQGPYIARSQGLPPSAVYTQGESYTDRSRARDLPNRFFVAMTLSGSRGNEWPYRWSFGRDLPLAEMRRVSFPLRLTQPGRYEIFLGIGVGNQIRTAETITGIEVVPDGQALNRTPNNVRPVPPTRITVNGQPVAIDETPSLREARVLVPVRFVMEALGADVHWDASTDQVTAKRGGYTMTLQIGQNYLTSNGRQVHMYPAPLIQDGRTMVPLRFITEALGGTAGWDNRTKTVVINVPTLPGGTAVASQR